jgi:hypothetical protein
MRTLGMLDVGKMLTTKSTTETNGRLGGGVERSVARRRRS